MPIECVLFDLDGVIRHFDDDHRAGVEQRYGLADGALLAAATEPDLYRRLVTGALTRAAWSAGVGELVGSVDAAAEWTTDIGSPDSATLALVDDLRASGYVVAILTNGTDTIPAELATLGIDRRVDAVFNSAEIGVAKPDPEVFQHVCAELGRSPESVFFTDDSPGNVAGAEAVGMTASVFAGVDRLRVALEAAGVDGRRRGERD